MESITPVRLAELRRAGREVELIDVRTPAEFREIHVPFARNIPLDKLRADEIACRNTKGEEPLYVICRSGGRGKAACEKLVAAGLRTVVNVDGGTLAWEASGLAVIRGKKTIALERQVRIAAGLLVLVGCLLGVLVHPYCFVLSALVGAGLVFAGVTDTCAMGLLLAKMPWNRVADDSTGEPAGCCRT